MQHEFPKDISATNKRNKEYRMAPKVMPPPYFHENHVDKIAPTVIHRHLRILMDAEQPIPVRIAGV